MKYASYIDHTLLRADATNKDIKELCKENNVKCSLSEVFSKGGEGGIELANQLIDTIENEESNYTPLYDEKLPIKEKIEY